MNRRIDNSYWVLRIGLGLGAFLAGLDKFFNILADWKAYLSPLATKIVPFSDVTFMHVVGMIEMVAGLALLTGFARIGGYVVMAWLIAIAINLVSTGRFYDLAVRDVEMALGAFVLARLAEIREQTVAEPRLAMA
jgi:uncharacterized membrane protein YphA (DoxX/SURF4 family)